MAEEIEMVRDAGGGHRKFFGDFAGGQVAFLEHFEDPAAGWIAQRFEGQVQSFAN